MKVYYHGEQTTRAGHIVAVVSDLPRLEGYDDADIEGWEESDDYSSITVKNVDELAKDARWMCRHGSRFHARVGANILDYLGLDEEEYPAALKRAKGEE